MIFKHLEVKSRELSTAIVDIASHGAGYNEVLKERLTALQSEWLRIFAAAIGLRDEDYSIRINRWSDTSVSFHSDRIRLQFSSCFSAPGLGLLVSGCESRRDHGMEDADWISMEDFRTSTLKRMAGVVSSKCGVLLPYRIPLAMAG